MPETIDPSTLQWLLEGDPAIRWQTLRDLTDTPEGSWQDDKENVDKVGWGKQFTDTLRPEGSWKDSRWTGAVWTLQTVMDCGVSPMNPPIRIAADQFLSKFVGPNGRLRGKDLLSHMDLCHLGFWLRIGSYFGIHLEELAQISKVILSAQFKDGGWNCRIRTNPKTSHSSFHTTFNVLEGLREAAKAGVISAEEFADCELRAMEFMLAHRLYKSDKTGQVVSERFLDLTYPSHWHYTVLRALDYIRTTPAIKDPRATDALDYIKSRRKPNGKWPVEKRIPGETLFEMEKWGGDGRWNTLKALRVLKSAGHLISKDQTMS